MALPPLRFPIGVPVAGVRAYQGAVRRVREGDRLVARREPDNPHDPNACVLSTGDGTVVGYLPAWFAARLVADGDSGCVWPVEVERVLRRDTWGLRVIVFGPTPDAGPADAAGGAVPAAVPPAARPPGPPVWATKSGRLLGTLVRHDRDRRRVVVDAGGRDVAYPDDLVRVGGPAA